MTAQLHPCNEMCRDGEEKGEEKEGSHDRQVHKSIKSCYSIGVIQLSRDWNGLKRDHNNSRLHQQEATTHLEWTAVQYQPKTEVTLKLH